MSHGSFDKNCIDWEEFDRLVDGQLDEFEYRELLHRIEEHPEGWRRCAMAFLEHQALQRELGELAEGSEPLFVDTDSRETAAPVGDTVLTPSDDDILTNEGSRRNYRGHLSALITMTACILVGLAIGNTATDNFRDVLRRPAGPVIIDGNNVQNVNNVAASSDESTSSENRYNTEDACKNSPRSLNQNFKETLREHSPCRNHNRLTRPLVNFK